MLTAFSTALLLALFAIVFAGLEIEAEGKYGWAYKMPTWYRTTGFVPRVYAMILGGKPLTGYHSYMFFMRLLVFHTAFFMGVPWTLQAELKALSFYFAFAALWDYYWFLMNHNYGFSKFRKENVWWHAKSYWVFGRLPHDYFVGWGLSILLAWGAGLLVEHLVMLGMLVLCTVLLILVSPLYHKWRRSMDVYDERDKVDVFHIDEDQCGWSRNIDDVPDVP